MLVRVLHRCTRLIVQQCEFSCRGNIGSKDILIKKSNENNRTGTLNINTSCCETVHPHVLMEYTTKSLNIHISLVVLFCARSIYCTSVHPGREVPPLFLFLRIPPFFFFFFLLQGVFDVWGVSPPSNWRIAHRTDCKAHGGNVILRRGNKKLHRL